ncbi:bardet-biedl syndrome 1 protein [Holotrichia oblita]|uniref:Bardet-biedl syndrome 1 protein n=1 Tax=Holotrichia oblita TaxID=644536 RepID=A0ACB9T3B8_HOLOL|nr:bardet-biedl syndrome 1 protein [Holotrichia oblita]
MISIIRKFIRNDLFQGCPNLIATPLNFFTPVNIIDLNISRWLEAHIDRSASLTTFSKNLVLADVCGDGEYRLVLTDLKLENNEKSRLKIYKGTVLTSDQTLPDIPSSIISFYTSNYDSKIPVIGVACGPDLLIYKNSKPYFKFVVPPLPIEALEHSVWNRLSEDPNIDLQSTLDDLSSIPYKSLSPRSQKLLGLQTPLEIKDFISKYKSSEPKKFAPITCMTTLNRSTQDKQSPACPIIATEAGQIFILDPQTFTPMHEAISCATKAIPCVLQAAGMYDVEFRIVIACREGSICLLRRGWLEGKVLIQATANIVDIVVIPGDHFIMTATTDRMLQCYTKRGNKLWNQKMNTDITCLCLIPLSHLSTSLLGVGLRGGSIQLFQGRHLVDIIVGTETPSAIAFGQLGQEEHVMVIITTGGAINFKILKRTADFNFGDGEMNSNPIQQTKPLPLPKRSKLFLEQSMRERQNAVDMHQLFQKDLIRLRLTAARATVQMQSNQSSIGNEQELVKLSAQVPLISPNLTYKIETKVQEKDALVEDNQDSLQDSKRLLRVFVVRKREAKPIVAATINMPPTDLSFLL